ncbi:MAG: hypothetical protein DI535_03585 [Citrobacter freundii]|nr:MAG: hypothetical protein DI535_03585 [Citrobacter freundii]
MTFQDFNKIVTKAVWAEFILRVIAYKIYLITLKKIILRDNHVKACEVKVLVQKKPLLRTAFLKVLFNSIP